MDVYIAFDIHWKSASAIIYISDQLKLVQGHIMVPGLSEKYWKNTIYVVRMK
jgi:hypothetical protein